jgi:monoamine oxidase
MAEATRRQFLRTSWHRQAFTGGGYTSFRPGQLTRFGQWLWIEGNTPGGRQETVFDRLFFIGEQLSDEYYGFMNGGAQTGRLAAEALRRML